MTVWLAACGSAGSGSGTGTTNPTVPTISSQPSAQTVTAGQTATFTVSASGTAPLTYQWFLNSAAVGTNSDTFSITQTPASDNAAQIFVTVSNTAGMVNSNTVTLTVNPVQASTANVLTFHNDVARTGQNLNETILTPAGLNSSNFGKVGFLQTDGLVDAEPLYVSNLTVSGAQHNVVFVVTEHDSAYAFDADTLAQLWKVSLLGANETSSDDRGCGQVTPEIGVTSTPVIDPHAGSHGAMYLVAMSKNSNGNYFHRLHALDITTGAEISGSPTTIQATFPNQGGQTTFDPKQYKERAALLLLNGVIYTTWASHCDAGTYTGWIMGYNQTTLQQSSVLNVIPNGGDGAIWMAGDGPAADSSGNFYFLDANGTFDTTLDAGGNPVNSDYGNAFVKISTANNTLSVADYFTMHNTTSESDADQDLGSGGEILLPDLKDAANNTWHLAVGAGKDSHIYVVNRDLMGKFNTSNDNAIYQEISSNGISGGSFATPSYFNNTVYYGAVGDSLKAFAIANAKLVTPPGSQSAATFGYPGATPSISANGTSSGIVWAVENNGGTGVLHAYDATNLATELYNSNQAANGRDTFSDNKFITPMIAGGKVYVGTPTGVIVFGSL
jgi:Immunoglobulin domain